MRKLLTKRVMIVGLALLLVGGGAGAFAATQLSSNPRQQYLDDVAKRLGVTPAQLSAAMKGASIDQIEAAVKAGKLTRAQADKIEQAINNGGPAPFGGPGFGKRLFGPGGQRGPLGFGFGFGWRMGGPFELRAVALKYLGISAATLKSELAAGKSLADIANSTSGKSAAGLEAALVADRKAELDKAVAAKQLTAAQEQKLLTNIQQRIHELVNMSFKNFKGGLMRKFRGPGGPGGPGFKGMFRGYAPNGGPPMPAPGVPVHPSYAPGPPPGGII